MKAKSSSQTGLFFFTRCLPIELAQKRCWLVLNVKFYHQIVANLPQNATGKVRILKTCKVRGFLVFGKMDVFFLKKILKFFKISKCGKLFPECILNGIISSKCLSAFFRGFLAKNQKEFKVGKIRIYDEQKGYFEKKNAFILLKGILNNVGAQNISDVVGCLVQISFPMH